MATSKTHTGPTPNGGVRSTLIFLDDDENNVDELFATAAEGVEYDANGEIVMRTYFRLNPTPNGGETS